MTNETSYAPIKYLCNGVSADFAFSWKIFEEKDLIVQIQNEAGEVSDLILGVDYSLKFDEVGGNVKLNQAYANGNTIIISRNVSDYQSKSYSTSSGFQSSEIEDSFDRVSCNLQEMEYNIENFKETFSQTVNQEIDILEGVIEENKQEVLVIQERFEDEVNTKIQEVSEAAGKINALEQAVLDAQTSADFAAEKAKEATEAIEEVKAEGEKQLQNIESTGFYMRDDKLYFINSKGEEEEFKSGGGSGFNLFDTKISDHILEGDEAKGWALQGTYVSKEFYPDFYNKCLEEYQNESNIPFGVSWKQPILTANGTMGGNSFAVEASSQYDATVPAWKAFDGTGTSNWVATTGVIPSWITFYNPVALNVTKLTILNRASDNDGVITAGEIQVSNNNSDWVTIKTFSNSVVGNTTAWEIDLSNNTEFYKYYRINGTSFARNYISIGEVKIQATYNVGVKHSNGHVFYDIAQKDQIDEVFASTGMADFYGIDEENERIFLPRNKYFQQLTVDVSNVNEMMEAGSPDITGTFRGGGTFSGSVLSGAFYQYGSSGDSKSYNASGGVEFHELYAGFDASRSNPIYGNSDTVQPPSSLKLLYYCVGNTQVISSITNVTEITESENDSNPLGSSFYFNNIQPNAGWLKSEGQWNDGNIYKTFYNWLVEEKTTNTSRTDIKDVSEVYTDFDYVLNQDDMTFRLPLLNGDESIMSKKYDDIDFPNTTTFTAPANGWYYIHQLAESASNFVTISRTDKAFADMVSTRILTVANNWAMFVYMQAYKGEQIKITSTSTKPVEYARFYYAKGNGDLYFKVANAVQNLELLDAGEVLESLSSKLDRGNKEEIVSWGVPDYDNGIILNGTSSLPFTAPTAGFINACVQSSGELSLYVNGNLVWRRDSTQSTYGWAFSILVDKGDVITQNNLNTSTKFYYFPLKGAN